MKQSQHIATTVSSDLVPIGGRKERDFERIVDYLAATLGSEHAAIFSEPQSSTDGSRIHWYINQSGPTARLDALDDATAGTVLAKFARIQADITRLASDLMASKDASERAFGRALSNAIKIPGQSYIYAVRAEPVLVGWGHRLADAQIANDEIGIRAPAHTAAIQPPETPISAPVEPPPIPQLEAGPDVPPTEDEEKPHNNRGGCLTALLWFILAGLIVAILYLLFSACALSFLPWFSYCNKQPAAIANLADLQREVRVLENAAAFKREHCSETRSNGPELNEAEISQRLDQRSAGNGALQVSLAWNGSADLDLAVRCQNGAVWFRQPTSCGAKLDTDSNGGRTHSPRPIENIVWQNPSTIPAGDLPIYVTLYSHKGHPAKDVPYTIRVVRREGGEIKSQFTINGVASRQSVKQPVPVGSANQ